tara:strand:- start:49 stop:207 length:159 start_codon:yes stop_codon:yes gene_type:complete
MNEEFCKKLIVCLEKIDNRISEQTKALQVMSEMIKINNDMIKKLKEVIDAKE